MNSNDQEFRELSRSELLEFLYFPVFFALFFLLQYYVIEVIPENKYADRLESFGGVALFGLLHVLASNILSFLYNLQGYVMPIRALRMPRATSKFLKLLGGGLLAFSVPGFFITLAYI